jgi:23S rRNA pseudouridine1911/1915/1917 synthase
MRLDQFLAQKITQMSRTKLTQLIKSGEVVVNGQVINQSKHCVMPGDEISIAIKEQPKIMLSAHLGDLNIVFEDDDLVVINKPAGLTVHPGAGFHQDTLVNILLSRYGENLSTMGGEARPGIVHRLDMNTSGLMVVAKNNRAHYRLSQMLAERLISRTYTAVVFGTPTPSVQTIKTQFGRNKRDPKKMCVLRGGGKTAITHIKLIQSFYENAISVLECKLETGRTHQIRVHLAHIGHGIVGDKAYNQGKNFNLNSVSAEKRRQLLEFPRQALHAHMLEFQHPSSGEVMNFSAPLPEDILTLID